MAYPTLTVNPVSVDFNPEYSTIKTKFEGGYQQTRERHTRNRATVKVAYKSLSIADRNLLLTHYGVVRGSDSFDWTDPDTTTVYTMRYDNAPAYKAQGNRPDRYDIQFTLREV